MYEPTQADWTEYGEWSAQQEKAMGSYDAWRSGQDEQWQDCPEDYLDDEPIQGEPLDDAPEHDNGHWFESDDYPFCD